MPDFNGPDQLPLHKDVLQLMDKIDSRLDPNRVSMQRRIGKAVSRAVMFSGYAVMCRLPPGQSLD